MRWGGKSRFNLHPPPVFHWNRIQMKAGVRERERNKALAAVVQVKARLEYSDYPNYSDILEF